jgi:hypothetical protein
MWAAAEIGKLAPVFSLSSVGMTSLVGGEEAVGIWLLELLWNLELGIWIFWGI